MRPRKKHESPVGSRNTSDRCVGVDRGISGLSFMVILLIAVSFQVPTFEFTVLGERLRDDIHTTAMMGFGSIEAAKQARTNGEHQVLITTVDVQMMIYAKHHSAKDTTFIVEKTPIDP